MMCYEYSKFTRKLERVEKIILVNSKTGQWIRMPDSIYWIIDLIVRNQYSYNEFKDKMYDEEDAEFITGILNKLVDLKLLVKRSEDCALEKKKVLLELTRRCNLNCIHCCVNANSSVEEDLSYSGVKTVLSNIVNNHPNLITLTGGEPLIRKDFFEILDFLRTIYDGNISLLTNGTLIDKKNVKQLCQYFSQIDISVDGVDEGTSTPIRGKGVFTKVIENVKLLKENNFTNISLSIVTGDKNRYLIHDFLELNERLGTKPVIRHFSSIGRGKENSSVFNDENRSKHIEESFFDDIIRLKHTKKFTACNCSVGKEVLYIDYRGDIYPCQWFTDSMYKIGNALIDNLNDLELNTNAVLQKLSKYHPSKFEKCKNCDVNIFCWPCPGELMVSSKEIDQFDEVCKKMKPILNRHIWGE